MAANLAKSLNHPSDVVEMESYKSNLLLEMGRLQGDMKLNQEQVFFLLRADRVLKYETQDLILKLQVWPGKLDELLSESEQRHEKERFVLEGIFNTERAEFLRETAKIEKNVKEVAGW